MNINLSNVKKSFKKQTVLDNVNLNVESGTIQAIIILLFVRYVLGVEFKGNVIFAILIMILLAFSAVSIGEFVSIFANSEFQCTSQEK